MKIYILWWAGSRRSRATGQRRKPADLSRLWRDRQSAKILIWWAGQDSNLRRRKPADLQSAPVDRFGTDPFYSIHPAIGGDLLTF